MEADCCLILECFRVRETGRVYCLVAEGEGSAKQLYIHRVPEFTEESWSSLPETFRENIEELEREEG